MVYQRDVKNDMKCFVCGFEEDNDYRYKNNKAIRFIVTGVKMQNSFCKPLYACPICSTLILETSIKEQTDNVNSLNQFMLKKESERFDVMMEEGNE